MTIPVPMADLAALLTRYGSAYLISVGADGRAKVITVDPVVEGRVLLVPTPSRGSAANIAANPQVTLAWPPSERHGFTLIVDGTAVADDAGITVTPEHGILHRPAPHAQAPDAPAAPYPFQANPNPTCGHDCAPIAPA
ncbi:MAG: pyridoxamine 5'-phosphate oxidase [Austwickia sp.]|nr:MAG: pyridoxamine 5'-phosphate oxidase [Austwickia sp.]